MLNSKFASRIRTFLSVKKCLFKDKLNKNYCSPCQEKYIDLCGKLVAITGGAGDIGVATAKELLKKHVKRVILAGKDDCEGEEIVEKINAFHGEGSCSYYHVDVSSCHDFDDFFNAMECKGGIDILINNAGIMRDREWTYEVDVNYTGVVRGCLNAMRHMGSPKRDEGGVVVNVAGAIGLDTLPYAPIFTATKAAIIALHRSLSDDFHFEESRIRFVCICPGKTKTRGLQEVNEQMLTPDWGMKAEESLKKLEDQEANHVAEGIVYGIEFGEPGVVFLIENKELKKVKLPRRHSISKHVASCVTNFLRSAEY
uniref:15-hydroxyprostaglandin dehydrogenase [NAD(+)] n=1 Tax=Rhodnius prolixus TaxID=13249 RepID=R4FL98_RHOPR